MIIQNPEVASLIISLLLFVLGILLAIVTFFLKRIYDKFVEIVNDVSSIKSVVGDGEAIKTVIQDVATIKTDLELLKGAYELKTDTVLPTRRQHEHRKRT